VPSGRQVFVVCPTSDSFVRLHAAGIGGGIQGKGRGSKLASEMSSPSSSSCQQSASQDDKDVIIHALRRQVDVYKAQLAELKSKDDKIAELESLLSACSQAIDWDGKNEGLSAQIKASSPSSLRNRHQETENLDWKMEVLAFEEDSPIFQRRIATKIEQNQYLATNLSAILEAARKWRKRAKDLQEAEKLFASTLQKCKDESLGASDLFGIAAQKFGDILNGMAEARERSGMILESTFSTGIEKFNSEDVAYTRELHKVCNKAQADHNAALTSFLNAKKLKGKSQQHQNQINISVAVREGEAIVALEQYELARLDLTCQLNRVSIRRQNELAECVVRGLFAMQTSIHHNYESIVTFLPELRRHQKIYPQVHSFLQETEDVFGKTRFELNRTLCRSVKLKSSYLSSSDADVRAFSMPAPKKGPVAMQQQRRLTLRQRSSEEDHSESGPILPRLSKMDSFVLLKESPPLAAIMRQPIQLLSFLEFLVMEQSVIHAAFWLDAERFRTLEDKLERRLRARALVAKYIDAGSGIALSQEKKDAINEKCANQSISISRSLFDRAQGDVLDLISQGMYTKFLRSKDWLNCRAKLSESPELRDTTYDPVDLEKMIPADTAKKLDLVKFESRYEPPAPSDSEMRCLIDHKSRVIINGPYESNDHEVYQIEYNASEAIGNLAKDVQVVYKSCFQSLNRNGLHPEIFDVEKESRHLRKLSETTSESDAASGAQTPSPRGVAQGECFDGQTPCGSSPGKTSPAHSRRISSSIVKAKIKTWASKRAAKRGKQDASMKPSQMKKEVALEAARVGRRLGSRQDFNETIEQEKNEEDDDEFSVEDDDEFEDEEEEEEEDQTTATPKGVSVEVNSAWGDTSLIIKQGFLRKRSSKRRKSWKRRWFVLKESQLFYVRDLNTVCDPVFVCECLLATVREPDPSSVNDMLFCFELLSPNRRTYVMQAESERAMRSWINAIRKCTERMITDYTKEKTSPQHSALPKTSSFVIPGQKASDEKLSKLQELNPTCADCGAPQPDWASISLGIFVCIECSGIHRSLGTHISKVRSLELDSWAEPSKTLIRAVGNKVSNDFWECDLNMQRQYTKPEPDSSRMEKEAFIHAKYLWRRFLPREDLRAQKEKMVENLVNACSSGNVVALLRSLVLTRDDDIINNWRDSRTGENLLHIAARVADLACCELLVQHGGKDLVDEKSHQEETPISLACATGNGELEVLFRREKPTNNSRVAIGFADKEEKHQASVSSA